MTAGHPSSPVWRSRRTPIVVFVTLFVVAVAVASIGVGVPVFWVDEYLTQRAVSLSWPELISHITGTDPGPGPYYVLMKLWSAVSTTPGWMRLPSVLAAAAAVGLLGVLVRRTTDTTTGMLAGAVLLIMPNVARFAQENRPYAFALLCTVLAVSVWSVSVEPDRPGRTVSRWWSVAFGAAVAALGLAHLYTLALLPALAAAALVAPRAERRRRFLRTVVPGALGLLVITPHLWLNLAHPTGSPTDPPLSAASLANLVRLSMPVVLAVALGVLALFGLAVGIRRPRLRATAVLAACWLLVPLVVLVIAKLAIDLPVTRVRYVLFVMPALAVLTALGLRHLARLSPPVALVGLLALTVAAIPRQVELRQADGHHIDQALDPLLRAAQQENIPVVAAQVQAVRFVNAATYPDVLLATTRPDRNSSYVAVVDRSDYRNTVRRDFAYYRSDRWRTVIRCRLRESHVVIVENVRLPAQPGTQELARRLTAATDGRVLCG